MSRCFSLLIAAKPRFDELLPLFGINTPQLGWTAESKNFRKPFWFKRFVLIQVRNQSVGRLSIVGRAGPTRCQRVNDFKLAGTLRSVTTG
jgi:hypothetical protein